MLWKDVFKEAQSAWTSLIGFVRKKDRSLPSFTLSQLSKRNFIIIIDAYSILRNENASPHSWWLEYFWPSMEIPRTSTSNLTSRLKTNHFHIVSSTEQIYSYAVQTIERTKHIQARSGLISIYSYVAIRIHLSWRNFCMLGVDFW